uniref:(California timema) hypothetical protein n=1 Tax=Timema californicum TaxID=61474 RepID=A0A7R9J428_TIMCA|nr:unnamed protein product [Timema californicum]
MCSLPDGAGSTNRHTGRVHAQFRMDGKHIMTNPLVEDSLVIYQQHLHWLPAHSKSSQYFAVIFALSILSMVQSGGQQQQQGYGSGLQRSSLEGQNWQGQQKQNSLYGRSATQYSAGDVNPDTGKRFTGEIYSGPDYYGYDSAFPGGRANFKTYQSAPSYDGSEFGRNRGYGGGSSNSASARSENYNAQYLQRNKSPY